jgi:hypothetical protein
MDPDGTYGCRGEITAEGSIVALTARDRAGRRRIFCIESELDELVIRFLSSTDYYAAARLGVNSKRSVLSIILRIGVCDSINVE